MYVLQNTIKKSLLYFYIAAESFSREIFKDEDNFILLLRYTFFV